MSQFNIRNLREISNEPLNKFTNSLAKKLSAFLTKDQIDKLEDKEDIYSDGQDVETVVRFHSLNSQNIFNFDTVFYSPSEPDGDKLTCWIKGNNLGNTTRDLSTFNNFATINGDPTLVDGAPFDYGIHGQGILSIARRMNRPTSDYENDEYLSIPNATNMQVSGIATGMSYFIRCKILDITEQDGEPRRLFEKIDDTTPNNGVQLRVTDEGRLVAIIKRAGTEYKKQTDTATIAASATTVYEIWVTYAVSGNAIKIYVNNVDKSLTDATSDTDWHNDLTSLSMDIFRRGKGSDSGHLYGDFYDFELFKEKVVSTAEVGYHYTNKWTLADIPFRQVMVNNYWASYEEPPPEGDPSPPSFTTTSFSSSSFSIT